MMMSITNWDNYYHEIGGNIISLLGMAGDWEARWGIVGGGPKIVKNVEKERTMAGDNRMRWRTISVAYGAGLGRFSLARPHSYTGPGGYVSGNPRPTPIRGPPALIPWTGRYLLPPIVNGDASGVWVGRGPERGQGQQIVKMKPRPRPLSGAERGKWPGGPHFSGPHLPRNEL